MNGPDPIAGMTECTTTEGRNISAVLTWECDEPDTWVYSGPTESLDRYLAGDIVTYHQLLTDTSPWCIKPIDARHQRRLLTMLDYTRRHDCDNALCQTIANDHGTGT